MPTRARLLIPVLAAAVALGACSGGASTAPSPTAPPAASPSVVATATPGAASPTTPASTPAAICTDAAAFRASMATLANLKVLQVGTSGVKAAVADVQTSAQALAASGKDLLAQPLSTLLASVTALQATLAGLGDQPSLGSKVTAITAAIEQIKTAAGQVEAALGTTCPAP